MIIGVDGNEANVKDQVGVSVYTHNLLEHFRNVADDKIQFRIFLKNDPLPTMPKESPHFSYKVISPRFMWSQLWLPLDLYMKKEIRTEDKWIKIRKKKHITEVLYGFLDGTNIHGHTVISGMNVILYQRSVSGMLLTQSGANLILNDGVLNFRIPNNL